MLSVLRLGERLHPELDAVFIAEPDRSVPLPTSTEIAKCWEDVHTELLSRFKTFSAKEWLERHGNVSPEEFERNPTRNRLAVLLGRTNHASYHFGQMMLAKPKTPSVAFATLSSSQPKPSLRKLSMLPQPSGCAVRISAPRVWA